MSTSKTNSVASIPNASSPVLNISRNKHLKHISAYHGPWLRLDNDFLSELLEVNASAKRPVPIHQGTLSDVHTIKKLVEEAIGLSIRATNQQSVTGRGNISKERQQRMYHLAVGKLVKAYALNEVAASVSTMQSASALEEVAEKVLRRDPEDLDALYVHFFHERIPSRQLAESTTLDSLEFLIRSRPLDAHLLRTRATVLTFKKEYMAAIKDLTSALSLLDYHKSHNGGGSLESQLLFMRGEAYLTMAVSCVSVAVESGKEELKKRVRQYARRSIKDFLKFSSLFDYTANLRSGKTHPLSALFEAKPSQLLIEEAQLEVPKPTVSEISQRVAAAKAKRLMELTPSSAKISQSAGDITKILTSAQEDENRPALTYHPLLPDCLHNLLLSHVLACTPSPEIKRHAERVIHITRTCDGYPVFLTPRSSARSDWTELLRRRGGELIGMNTWHSAGLGTSRDNPKEYPVSERAGLIADWIDVVFLDREAKYNEKDRAARSLHSTVDGHEEGDEAREQSPVTRDGTSTMGKSGLVDESCGEVAGKMSHLTTMDRLGHGGRS